VCSSGLTSKDLSAVVQLVSELGGHYSDNLTPKVTQLIVKRVGSEKHRKAIQNNIPCVELQWLIDCKNQKELLSPVTYKIRVFTGLVVCVTGTDISPAERYDIQRIIEAGGGIFSKQMIGGQCTHLVASEAKVFNTIYAER
jgi:hypothetical protein